MCGWSGGAVVAPSAPPHREWTSGSQFRRISFLRLRCVLKVSAGPTRGARADAHWSPCHPRALREGLGTDGWGQGGPRCAWGSARAVRRCSTSKVQWAARQVDPLGLPRDLPPRARWYPARVCYGRQFELVFSTEEEVDKVALEADWLAWSASAEAFASKHQLKLVFESRGFKRGENCKTLLFTTPEAFEDCFGGLEESASVPISVEWVELPAQVKRRRQQKRASAKAQRQPCLTWRFTKATYDPPEGGLEIRMTFRWPNGARRVFRGTSVDLVDLPAVTSGSKIGYFIEDVDLVFDDKLASGTLEVPSRLDDGALMAEGLTLHGRCEQRKKPPRRKNPGTR